MGRKGFDTSSFRPFGQTKGRRGVKEGNKTSAPAPLPPEHVPSRPRKGWWKGKERKAEGW